MTDADTLAHDSRAAERRGVTFQRVSIGGLPVAVLDREQTARLTISAALARRGSDRPCLDAASDPLGERKLHRTRRAYCRYSRFEPGRRPIRLQCPDDHHRGGNSP